MKFTKEQIDNWNAYEDVRLGGLYNMFDSRARMATGLDKTEYFFTMKNFSELRKQAMDELTQMITNELLYKKQEAHNEYMKEIQNEE
jgi:hypothetical protein